MAEKFLLPSPYTQVVGNIFRINAHVCIFLGRESLASNMCSEETTTLTKLRATTTVRQRLKPQPLTFKGGKEKPTKKTKKINKAIRMNKSLEKEVRVTYQRKMSIGQSSLNVTIRKLL